MILPEVSILSYKDFKSNGFGMDTLQNCKDKDWFNKFPDAVSYEFNSRGFRDAEWPEDLKDAVWCIGDSFTIGIGLPSNQTWPSLLSKVIPQNVINVSRNGASNDYIARISKIIKTQINPYAIIHQWSYIHRRELPNLAQVRYLNSSPEDDIENLIQNIKSTNDERNIHSMIPYFEPPGDFAISRLKKENFLNVIYDNKQLDFGRDYYHYGVETAKKYVDYYKEILNTFGETS